MVKYEFSSIIWEQCKYKKSMINPSEEIHFMKLVQFSLQTALGYGFFFLYKAPSFRLNFPYNISNSVLSCSHHTNQSRPRQPVVPI
jgi:hypothetical protein